MNEIKLFSSTDDMLISQVCEILKENNIPFIKKQEGSGAYVGVLFGSTMGIKDIFVSEEDYEKAKGLIEGFENN